MNNVQAKQPITRTEPKPARAEDTNQQHTQAIAGKPAATPRRACSRFDDLF